MQCLVCMNCRAKVSLNSVRVNVVLLSHKGHTKHNILTVFTSVQVRVNVLRDTKVQFLLLSNHPQNHHRVANCVKNKVSDLHFRDLRSISICESEDKVSVFVVVAKFFD